MGGGEEKYFLGQPVVNAGVLTHQIRVERLLQASPVILLQLGGVQSVSDVKSTGVEAAVLMVAKVAILAVASVVQVLLDAQRLGVECALASAADLLVDVVERLGHVERRADADGRAVQMTGSDLRYVADAVDLLVLVAILIVVVGLQCQFGAACRTLEAALVEECKVL